MATDFQIAKKRITRKMLPLGKPIVFEAIIGGDVPGWVTEQNETGA